MSEVTPPEPTLPEPPRRNPWTVWGTMASAMLHVGLLAFFLLQPRPDSAEATPPAAIDVELVQPPEAISASEPPAEEPGEEASAATLPPAKTTPAEPPPTEQAAGPTPSAAEISPSETPSEKTAAPETAYEASATAASEPVRGSETSAQGAPIPLSRPRVSGLTAPASVPDGAVTAVTADTGEMAEGTAPPAPSAKPDVATLELGALRSAKHFYLEAMLSAPSMARARAMLETLPPEKRLAQTCNIEALAQIGNAGERFAPDVVMAEAYARSEMTGTRLAASGAIFRSGERWYGLAFDCTLSDDLTSVTAFSYRLGADVTEAVLARLSKT
jgi:cytoskeletal protein RodZ